MQKPACSPVPAVFSFESHDVRTIVVGEEVWFVARDVAAVLGYAKPEKAISSHCKHAKSLASPELGGQVPAGWPRNMMIIPERDVYRLIMRSTLPAAEKFEDWIVSEVIPSIRKHGHYGQPVVLPADPMQILKVTYDALVQVNTRVDEVQETVTRLLDTVRLQQWQCYELKAAVTQKAQEFRDTYNCTYALLFPAVWGFVKKHFRVATYSAIPTVRFDEALALVKAITFGDMPDYVRESAGGAK